MAQGSHVIVSYGCVEGMLGLKGYLPPWEYPWLNLGTRLGTTAVTMPQDGTKRGLAYSSCPTVSQSGMLALMYIT